MQRLRTRLRAGATAFPPATFALNFLTGALDSGVTFTRGTTATFVGSNGFIQTAAINAPRFDYDPVTLAAKGLLIEEQRTNLLLRSAAFDNASWSKSGSTVTANATTSPDGTADADKLVETATTGQHRASQAVTVTSGVAYTYSIYAKAAERTSIWVRIIGAATFAGCIVDLTNGAITGTTGTSTATNVGNGWYRITVSGTSDSTTATVYANLIDGAGANTYTGDGTSGLFVWGAQVEAGAFATSYIPTVTSQVTRSADVATMTGTNFSSWYNQSEGTFVASFQNVVDPAAGGKAVFSTNDGTNNNRVTLLTTTAAAEGRIVVGGVATNPVSRGFTGGSVAKSGIAFAAGSGAQYTNGVLNSAVTPSAAPTVNRLEIGANLTSSFLNGHIRQIAYYNTRLPNDTLVSLTA